eukprot:1406751-Rhodomonas_salina.1
MGTRRTRTAVLRCGMLLNRASFRAQQQSRMGGSARNVAGMDSFSKQVHEGSRVKTVKGHSVKGQGPKGRRGEGQVHTRLWADLYQRRHARVHSCSAPQCNTHRAYGCRHATVRGAGHGTLREVKQQLEAIEKQYVELPSGLVNHPPWKECSETDCKRVHVGPEKCAERKRGDVRFSFFLGMVLAEMGYGGTCAVLARRVPLVVPRWTSLVPTGCSGVCISIGVGTELGYGGTIFGRYIGLQYRLGWMWVLSWGLA